MKTYLEEEKKSGIGCLRIENQIGILTIDNGKQNKIDKADFIDLNYFKEWLSQSNIKGLIITGSGRNFSSGADVDNIRLCRNDPNYLKESLKKGKDILSFIEKLPIITVAAINGVCFGAGLEIALSCQFRICSTNAILAFPESNIGIMPGLSGNIRLPKKIGRGKAIEIIISGRTVNADEANEIGLVDKIVSNKEHISSALKFINDMTENKSIHQIKSIIQSINNSIYEKETVAMEYEGDMFLDLIKYL